MNTESQPQSENAPSVRYHLAHRMKKHHKYDCGLTAKQQTMQTSAKAQERKETTNGRERTQTTATESKTNANATAQKKNKANESKSHKCLRRHKKRTPNGKNTQPYQNKQKQTKPYRNKSWYTAIETWQWKPQLPSGRR